MVCLGLKSRGGRMESTDESTELCRLPNDIVVSRKRTCQYFLGAQRGRLSCEGVLVRPRLRLLALVENWRTILGNNKDHPLSMASFLTFLFSFNFLVFSIKGFKLWPNDTRGCSKGKSWCITGTSGCSIGTSGFNIGTRRCSVGTSDCVIGTSRFSNYSYTLMSYRHNWV